MKKSILILMMIVFTAFNSFAQLKFGADVYSRYNWRGLDFGDAPAFQPSISYALGGLTVGVWSSYAFPTAAATYSENDLYASYTYSTEAAGSFSLLYTDYYIPSAGIPFGFYKPTSSSPAAHTLEGGISYSGPINFPVTLAIYTNLSNDAENSSYIQIGYPLSINEATVTLIAGFTPSKSAYYGTTKGSIINLGICATKTISVTDKFSIPVTVSYIGNPSIDKTYLIFGISFVF